MRVLSSRKLIVVSSRLVCGVVVLCFCAYLGYTLWADVKAVRNPAAVVEIQPASIDFGNNSGLTIKALVGLNLMGKSAPKTVDNPEPRQLPETRLKLTLIGTLASTEAKNTSALIAERGKVGARYFIDDRVPGGATVVAVHVDRVVLRLNGRQETLFFPRPSSSTNNLSRP